MPSASARPGNAREVLRFSSLLRRSASARGSFSRFTLTLLQAQASAACEGEAGYFRQEDSLHISVHLLKGAPKNVAQPLCAGAPLAVTLPAGAARAAP